MIIFAYNRVSSLYSHVSQVKNSNNNRTMTDMVHRPNRTSNHPGTCLHSKMLDTHLSTLTRQAPTSRLLQLVSMHTHPMRHIKISNNRRIHPTTRQSMHRHHLSRIHTVQPAAHTARVKLLWVHLTRTKPSPATRDTLLRRLPERSAGEGGVLRM